MKTVKKIWGEELWVINTKKYCGKILKLKKGFFSSIHKHLEKDETFYMLEGAVKLELEKKDRKLVVGDVQRILPGQFHRFIGLEDSIIIEFSTFHRDEDTVRKTESGKI